MIRVSTYEQDNRSKLYIINHNGDATDIRKSLNVLEHVTLTTKRYVK